MATTTEKAHLAAVAALGCIICHALGCGHTGPNTAIHHVRRCGEKRDHMKTLPLCPAHHQTGGYGVAIHAGEEAWEALYGTQEEMLKEVDELLGRRHGVCEV